MQGRADVPLALSVGDPSGVGPEIAVAAWHLREKMSVPAFYLLADPALVAARARLVGRDLPIEETTPEDAADAFLRALPVVPLAARFLDAPGRPSPTNAAGVIAAIDRAVDDCFSGRAAAVVTCPIAKKPLYDAGFGFPGHTEYLAHLAAQHTGVEAMPVMMLAGPDLRTVPVTIHIPLADVPKTLTTGLIAATARITAHDLETRFGIAKPRLAIAGLNPHAGEGGTMGLEDRDMVRPAVDMLRAEGIQTIGIDPTEILIEQARRRDPEGDYRLASAEELPFPGATFDLVASYLTLIDIPDVSKAISEMARVLKPGGRLLIANLTGFGTAGDGWSDEPEPRFCIDRYLEIRELLSEWKGIRITNWHRPLSYYMQLLLCEGLILRHFDEPPAHGGDPATVAKYDRVPWLMMMEWEKH